MKKFPRKLTPTRRTFLRTVLGAAVAPALVPWTALGAARPAPSERIGIGIIGLGSRGFNLLHSFLREPDAQVVAVCDVDSKHYRDNPWGEGQAFGLEPARKTAEEYYARRGGAKAGVGAYRDYRELLAHEGVDAVVIVTPDHWHALCTLEALRLGKDVYCEKPLTHLFREGQLVYREAERRNAVFQAGSQQRSDERFRRAVELVQNGHLGQIRRVEMGLPPGYSKPMGDTTVEDPPEHVDYDFWCGPSIVLPYVRARHHRWWRGHLAYGGGVLMDWLGHHNDIAHWAVGMDKSGPTKVEAVGWTYPETNVYNTPENYEILCQYPGGIVNSISNKNREGLKLIGEDGWVYVDRGVIEASDERWTKKSFDPGPVKAYVSERHTTNFVECVKSRQPCVAPAETAHRSVTAGHLGYVSNTLGRPLDWDPDTERVINDDEADTLLKTVNYRQPWKLEA
ncbi:MAG: Gfo/Idh/MocA family oxidoreductase [Candidatus Hydrogenedentes bacterium]|nr:Gfo/Idh/MocA family oxidoreductase [Candidatus Hydrogenedentota bacterium]